jgi:acyl carrier protein
VVIAEEASGGDRRLVAYLTHGARLAPTVTELRSFLRVSLPDYMVPSLFVALDSLPLTPNGKVDRKKLRGTAAAPLTSGRARVLPRTAMERHVAELWQDALHIDTVSITDNFFDLGGHSLLAVRILARLETLVGRRINPREIIFQTLEQFAAGLEPSAVSVIDRPPTPMSLTRRLLRAVKRGIAGR